MDRSPYFNQNNWSQHYAADFNSIFTVGQSNPSEQHGRIQNTNVTMLPNRANESIGFDGFTPDPVINTFSELPSQSTAFSGPTERASDFGSSSDSVSSFLIDYSVLVSSAEVETFVDMVFNEKDNPERLSRNTCDYPQQNDIHANTNIHNNNNNYSGTSSSNNYENQQTMRPNSVYMHENRTSYCSFGDPVSQYSSQLQSALQQSQNVYGSERTAWQTNPPSGQEYGDHRAPVTDLGSVRSQSTAITTTFLDPAEPLFLESSTDVANELPLDDRQERMPPFLAEQIIDMLSEQRPLFSGKSVGVMSTQTNGYRGPKSPSEDHYVPPPNNANTKCNDYSTDGAHSAWYRNDYGDLGRTERHRPSSHLRTMARDFDQSSQQSLRFESGAQMSTTPVDNKYSSVVSVNTTVGGRSSSDRNNRYCTGYEIVGVSPGELNKTAHPTDVESASCSAADAGPTESLDFTECSTSEAVVNGNLRTADGNANVSLPARCYLDRAPKNNETLTSPAVTTAAIKTIGKIPTLESNRDNSGSKNIIANETTDPNQPMVQLHRGVKRHRCQDCGQCFSYPHEWKLHKKTHMDVKLYTCYKCGESFAQLFLLESHSFVKHSK